jgi:hypothetical protein
MARHEKDRASPEGSARPLSNVQSTTTNNSQYIPQDCRDQFPVIVARLTKNRREQLRIALDRYQGIDLIDLRVTVNLTETSSVQTPTKKGLSLQIGQLPGLIEALQAAQARAVELGLIEGGT